MRYTGNQHIANSGRAFINSEWPVRSDLQRRAHVMPSVSGMPWSSTSAGVGNLNYQAGALQPRNRATDRIAAWAGHYEDDIAAAHRAAAVGDHAGLGRAGRLREHRDAIGGTAGDLGRKCDGSVRGHAEIIAAVIAQYQS